MTREEAIKIIERVDICANAAETARDMAIAALKEPILVHCKDCKHWKDGVEGCTDYVKCCQIGFYMVHENGYCVYGERKET